jgi:ribosome-associated heat shock protein Hsp15
MRLYKTRSIATDACKNGRILVNNMPVKPSFCVSEGMTVQIKKSPIIYTYRIIQITENRVGAKLVPELMENITSQEQYEILEMSKISGFIDRQRGTGRPTKKERRDLDFFVEESYNDEFDEFDFDEL